MAVLAIPGQALRLIGRHGPTILVLILAGQAIGRVCIDLAVEASALSGALGLMVLVLAPVAQMISFVLVLRVLRTSLRTVPPGTVALGRRAALDRLLTEIGSVLVPFLAIYYSSGRLQADAIRYSTRVTDAVTNAHTVTILNGGTVDADELDHRLLIGFGLTIAALIVVAFALRKGLAMWKRGRRIAVVLVLGAYAEALWLLTSIFTLNTHKKDVQTWFGDRAVIEWVKDAWHGFVDALGPLSSTAERVGGWVEAGYHAFSPVVLVPVAWLTVGAVVFGELVGPEARTAGTMESRLRQRLRTQRRRVRRASAEVESGLRSRFGPLLDALRLMVRHGLVAMAVFCAVFVGAQWIGDLLWAAERALIGPHGYRTFWDAALEPLQFLNDAVATGVLLCVVAAGAARITIQPVEEPVVSSPDEPAARTVATP